MKFRLMSGPKHNYAADKKCTQYWVEYKGTWPWCRWNELTEPTLDQRAAEARYIGVLANRGETIVLASE